MSSRTVILASALLVTALPASGQVPDTAAAIERVTQGLRSGTLDPDALRARIEAAGLTMDEVGVLLRQAGYPQDLLDQFLGIGPGGVGSPGLSSAQLEDVLRRLSIPPIDPAVAESLAFAGEGLGMKGLAADTAIVPPIGLPIFGMSLFESTTQFLPLAMGPVSSNYKLGPGDELVLILTGAVQDIYVLPITREGFVVIPNVGRVSVNGLTLDQLRNALYTYLGRVYSGVMRGTEATTFFEVSISTLRRSQVFVIGEVKRPGQYEVSSVSTVLDALYRAAGPTANGSFRNIEIRRGNRVVGVLDVYDYLTSGAAGGDVTLDQGDVVFVPVRGRRVEIDGNVIRPGIYELKGTEGLRALLDLAGGIEPEADLRRVQIDRILPQDQRESGLERSLFDVNVAELLDDEGELFPIVAGDRVYVFAVADKLRNTVTIRGDIWAPGVYGHSSGMTLRDLIERAGGLRQDAYLGRAQIVRLDPLNLSQRVVPVSLGGQEDPELQEYDEVFIYGVGEFRTERFVTIYGAVQNPGVYPFRDDMTIRDVILMAGGLVDGAYTAEAEVSRVSDRAGRPNDLAEIVTVPLDSSYVVSEPQPSRQGGNGSSNGNGSGAPEFTLEGYDNVFIRRQPGWEPQRTVTITGEVRFPGQYALSRKDEGLRELIERAGGLTQDAYADGIRFFRRRGSAGEVRPYHRVNVDLPDLLDSSSADVTLAAGDSIVIPEFEATVLVEGAVLYPTAVMYKEGAGLDYYVGGAGGYARDADKGRARVEHANGSVGTISSFLFFKSKPKPDPGSRVFVPAKPPPRGGVNFRTIASVLVALTTMVIVIARN